MTFDLAQTSGIDPEINQALTIVARLDPLRDALGLNDLTVPEMQLFAMVAAHTGLDPFTRQLYAVKRKGKVVHQTGIDGYRATAERTREYAGSDEATFEDCDCGTLPAGHPKLARVVVHRNLASGHVVDQVGIARWHELYPGNGDDGFMWRKMPFNQLAKCAEANGLRKAFPFVLGGVYIEDEMQQADAIEGTAVVLPTAQERIAARRAAAESTDPTPQEAASEPSIVTDEADGPDDESRTPAPTPPTLPDAAVVASPEPTANPSAPDPFELCGNASPYGDGGSCGLPFGHKGLHRQLDIAGKVTGSWPTT